MPNNSFLINSKMAIPTKRDDKYKIAKFFKNFFTVKDPDDSLIQTILENILTIVGVVFAFIGAAGMFIMCAPGLIELGYSGTQLQIIFWCATVGFGALFSKDSIKFFSGIPNAIRHPIQTAYTLLGLSKYGYLDYEDYLNATKDNIGKRPSTIASSLIPDANVGQAWTKYQDAARAYKTEADADEAAYQVAMLP